MKAVLEHPTTGCADTDTFANLQLNMGEELILKMPLHTLRHFLIDVMVQVFFGLVRKQFVVNEISKFGRIGCLFIGMKIRSYFGCDIWVIKKTG